MNPQTDVPELDISALRFLVVEDQGFQRWAVTHLLENMGVRTIISAGSGDEALEMFKCADPPIDVVVSDLNMPGMDGMEFIRHLGATGQPVAVIVASDLDKALVASVAVMAKAYGVNLLEAIHKPITIKKLAAALSRYPRVAAKPAEAHVFTLDEIVEGIRNNEFEPYFQPKLNIATQALIGAEALARWRHPEKGLVMPAAFIEVLEATWQIDTLTESLLRKAAHACRQWRDNDLDLSVAVNVSLTSLTDLTLADRLTAIVTEEGLQPRNVILEITETAAATHLGKALENLARLRLKGFGLAIDDYGTGYSSMQQLTHIPFTELKIDRSFVQNAVTKRSSRAVLESSLEIASKLGISAVAEGVEAKEQLILLRELGCPLAQGYLLGRPMMASDFLRWGSVRSREAEHRGA